jgi:hypothetical protein
MIKSRKFITVLVTLLIALIWLVVAVTPVHAVADRYWVGGTGNYNDTNHWSLADGGASGASVPGAGNDAHFTANSDSGAGFTVTINVASSVLSWDSSTVDQVMTLAGSSSLSVYGNLAWKSDHVNGWTGTLLLAGTGGGNTLNFAGVALASTASFNGAGGDWTFTGDFLNTGVFNIVNGDIDTAGYTVTSHDVYGSAGTNSLTLGATDWSCAGDWTATLIDVIDSGTSTITMSQNNAIFTGHGRTYYTVIFDGTNDAEIKESNTFTNLTRTGVNDNDRLELFDDITVTGTFTANGPDASNRIEIRSSAAAQRDITAGSVAGQYSSYYYINGLGAASWDLSGHTGGAADLGGNSNITFTSNLYWVGGAGTWGGVNWSHASGGTTNGDWLPNQNTNVFLDAFSTSGDISMNGTSNKCLDFNASALTVSKDFGASSTAGLDVYGDYIGDPLLGTNCGTNNFTLEFVGSGNHNWYTGGITNADRWQYKVSGNAVAQLQDELINTNSLGTFIYGTGSIVTNDNNITLNFTMTHSGTGAFNDFGASTVTLNGNWNYTNANAPDMGTSTIICESFASPGFTYYDVEVNAQGTTSVVRGINTFHDLTLNADNTTIAEIEIEDDQLITNDILFTGYNSSSKRLRIVSDVPGTQRTLYVNNNASLLWTDMSDIIAGGTSSPWDATIGLNGDFGNNLYITFTSTIDTYWVGNTGSWSDTAHWSATSGGAGGTGRVPLINDVAIFDGNSVTLPLQTITMDMLTVPSITATAIANNPTVAGTTINVYGSLALGDLTLGLTSIYFTGKHDGTLQSLNDIPSLLYINKDQSTMAHVLLQGDVTVLEDVELLQGTLKLGTATLIAERFISDDSTYNRALDMDTGIFEVNSTGTKWDVVASKMNVVDSPDSTIHFTSDLATACTFAGGSQGYGNILINGAGAYTTTISGTNSFNQFAVDRGDAAKTITGNVTVTILDMSIPVSGATTVTITNTDWTMVAGEIYGDYLVISGSAAAGGGTFWASAGGNSTDNGGNSGWLWTIPTPPTIVTLDPSNVSYLGEQLNGEITNAGQYNVFYTYFEYGPTVAYGFLTAPETTLTAIGLFDSYLSPYKVYHYRAAVRFGLDVVAYGADKVVSLSGAVGQAIVDVTTLDLTASTSLVDSAPAEPSNMYTEGQTGGLLGLGPLVNNALAKSNTPQLLFWYPISFAIAIGLGFLAYGKTRTLIAQAFVSAIVMAMFAGGGVLGSGLIPYWTVLVFIIEAIMLFLIQEKQNA